jgi:RNA polymerase sigma-54 factor
MDQRLGLQLRQKLALTPALQQAIKILLLSKMELTEHVRQELEENPVLEEIETAPDPTVRKAEREFSSEEQAPPAAETKMPEESPYPVEFDWAAFGQYEGSDGGLTEEPERDGLWYENTVSAKPELRDHLLWQLFLTVDDPERLVVGAEIIGNIDEEGYLRTGTDDLAAALAKPLEVVEAVLAAVHSFDPAGVGARTVEECLLLQLKRLPEPNPLAERIVNGHLAQFQNRNHAALARKLKAKPEEMEKAARVIAHLNPKPGLAFAAETDVEYIVPDLFVEKEGDDYRVVMNNEGIPRLRISSYYRNLLGTQDLPGAARDYIQKKFSSAVWLVKSIHQRQRTIRKVAESIVRHQRAFLDHGMDFLKPMVLRDVAEDIGVHESTVSRVTNRKYAQTPQGLFELKFFFTSGIARESGLSAASTSVQSILRKIIDSEPADRPYSDQDLVILLKRDHGLVVARRTIAKYRDILRILPSSKRRRGGEPTT